MPITKEQFDLGQAANPGTDVEILVHDKLPDEILVRTPPHAVYAIFRNMQADGKKLEAMDALIFGSRVAPSKEEVQGMLDGHPALREVWAGELIEMAGYTAGARRKKF